VEGLTFDVDRRIYFATQGSVRPPTFVFFTDKVRDLHFSHERFLVNRLRERFGFRGTPVVIKLKKRH
jgi:GTP-binding protein